MDSPTAPPKTDSQPYSPPRQPYPPSVQRPITGKPGAGEWMHPSLQESLQEYSNPNCLLGLEYLNPIDQLLIHQEVRTGCETANKFTIKNSMGQRIFYAVENSDCCEFCMQENRSYLMKIVDTNQHEVIELIRPSVTCKSPERMEVRVSGEVIGTVQLAYNFFTPKFHLRDESEEIVLTVKEPPGIGLDNEYKVYSKGDPTEIDSITRMWSGFIREIFHQVDNYEIVFSLNLNVKYKALLLATCLHIDLTFYDRNN